MPGALRDLLAQFHIGVDDKELDKADEKVGSFIERLKKVGESILAAFAVEKVTEFVKSQVEAATGLQRTAIQLGTTTDELQAMNFAAQQAGVGADALSNGLRFLNLHIAEAAQGGGEAAQLFKEAGVSITDAAGKSRPAGDIMSDLADHIASIQDPAKQTQLAMRLLGRGGVELIPLLKQGGGAFDEARKKVQELGGGISNDFIAQAKEAEDATADLNFAMTGLKTKIAAAVLPIFMEIVKAASRIIAEFSKAVGGTHLLTIAMAGLGAAMVAAAPLPAAIAVAFVILFAAAYELVRLFQGKDSLIGRMLGPDKKAFVDSLRQAVDDLSAAFGSLASNGDGGTSSMQLFAEAVLAVAKALAWVIELIDAVGNGLEKLAAPISDVLHGDFGRAGADLKDIGKTGRKNREAYDRDEARPQLAIDAKFAKDDTKAMLEEANMKKIAEQLVARRQLKKYQQGEVYGPLSPGTVRDATAGVPTLSTQVSAPAGFLRPGENAGFFRPPSLGAAAGLGNNPGAPIEINQTNETHVEIHGVDASDARAVGDAAGAGVANAHQRANEKAFATARQP